MNGLDDFVSEWEKIHQAHFRKGNWMEFANGPFGFVGDVPRIQSGMGAEFAEERKKNRSRKDWRPAAE